MKRFICFILVIIMLLPALPVMAAGDTVAGADNAYFKVGDNYYSTLAGALSYAPTSTDKTIYLLKNATISEKGLSLPAGAQVIFDFGGYTLNVNNTTEYFINKLNGTLTVKNGTINLVKGIVVKSGGHLIIENMSYNINNKSSSARPAVKLSEAGTTRLTVKNSYLKTVGPGEALVLVEYATDGIINLEGNTTLEYAGVLDSAEQNCAPIAIQQSWGTGVDSSSDEANTDLVLNVGSDVSIINRAPAIDSDYVASAIVMQTRGDLTLNLEAGATIEIDRATGSSKSYHIATTKYKGNIILNDKGANWVASAKTLREGGIYLADICNEGETVIGWTDGERLIKSGALYADKNATENVSLSPVRFNSQDFDIIDGAAIRKKQNEPAIRFSTIVSNRLIELLGDNVSFGTLIAEGSTSPLRVGGDTYDVNKVKFLEQDAERSVYRAAIFFEDDFADGTAYAKRVSAVSYMTVSYYDGTEATFYTAFDYNNTRSMRQVAKNMDGAGQTCEIVEHILGFPGDDGESVSSVLVGYCTEASLYDGAFNSQVGWKAAGMGNIIRTSDGKIIAIDGGNTEDAYGFYNLLREYCQSDKVVVDYWILTHPHGDHVGALVAMTKNNSIKDNIEIKNLIFHFPSDFNDSGNTSKYNTEVRNIAKAYGANIINPIKGQVIYLGEAEITFLYVCTNYANYTTANEISLVFTVETEKTKIMFTGDVYIAGLTQIYNEYGSSLKCDVLQMPHHFLCDTGYKQFYEAADASVVLLPTCIAGYEAMYNDPSYKDSTKHKANAWAAQNADAVYKAFDGT